MRFLKLSFLIILILFVLTGCSSNHLQNSQKIENGVLYIQNLDSIGTESVNLNGSWEFYWNKLINFAELPEETPDLYAKVPDTWDNYYYRGEKLPGVGCATYRLHVITDLPEASQLGLILDTFSSAYHLYINEKLIASNGKPSTIPEDEVGKYRPMEVFFQIPDQEFDIIIQVSNYECARGGFRSSAYLGNQDEIKSQYNRNLCEELFFIGVLATITFYFFTMYIINREFKYSLYFSLLCGTSIITLDTIGQYVIFNLFPWMSFRVVYFIWYASAALVTLWLLLYVHELFTSKVSKIMVIIAVVVISTCLIFLLFNEPLFYTRLTFAYNFLEIVGAVCAVVIVAIGIRNGCRDGWFNIISMLVAVFSYIANNLYMSNEIDSRHSEVLYVGFFLFICIQMIIQMRRIKAFYNTVTATELAFLQAQIKPHFIYNSLNTFVSISYFDIEKSRELLVRFADYLRRCFDIKLDQYTSLKNELELTNTFIEIEKVRFEERLEILFEESEDMEVRVPMLVLQPIVENAIVHGVLPKPEGGRIEISIRNEHKYLVFRVKDNGVGMDIDKNMKKQQKENRVGLSNIDNRLKKLYGKGLRIKSILGEGTEIIWSIPLNKKNKR